MKGSSEDDSKPVTDLPSKAGIGAAATSDSDLLLVEKKKQKMQVLFKKFVSQMKTGCNK